MAPKPDGQQTSSGSSTSAVPAALNATPQNVRQKVVMQWEKESKIKTCKCKICDQRVKKFCHRCKSCGKRICSECSEDDGQSSAIHKEIALDYLQDGCWCGFRSNFNSAFRGRIPPVQAARPVVAPAPVESKKRQRTESVKNDAESKPPPTAEHDLSDTDDTRIERVSSAQAESSAGPAQVAIMPGRLSQQPEEPPLRVRTSEIEDDVVTTVSDDSTSTEPAAKKRRVHRSEGSQIVLDQTSPAVKEPVLDNEEAPAAVDPLTTAVPSKAAVQQTKRVKRASRKPDVHDQEEIPASSAPTASSSRRKAPKELAPRSIVIIGAGVIGMFTALELAKRAYANGKKQHITVVDINDAPCTLASGQSAGFLTVRDMPESWLPLVNAAAPIWGDLTETEELCKAVGFSQEVFTIAETGERRRNATPWINDTINKNVVYDEDSLGMIDSTKLASWLQKQCEGYGVEFRFNTHPSKVEIDRSGIFTGVRVHNVDADAAKAEILKCSHMVLATGPFTKPLFRQLFPASPLRLENHIQSTEWMKLAHASLGKEHKVGIMIPHATDEHVFEGHLGLAIDPSKRSMRMSCSQRPARISELKQRDALESPQSHTAMLSELSAKYLDPKQVALSDERNIVSHGSAYTSTGTHRAPVIGRVRPTLIDPASSLAGSGVVWLCYGFGTFGTTVAPGVGRAIAEMMHGDLPTVDLSDFAIQEQHEAKDG